MITRDDWLRALNDLEIVYTAQELEAVTVKEFAALIGCSRSVASLKLTRLVREGKAEKLAKRQRRADGGILHVPAYRLKPL